MESHIWRTSSDSLYAEKRQRYMGALANIDCKENIVSLCPICHRAVHVGNQDEKESVVILISKRLPDLQELDKCNNKYISPIWSRVYHCH